MKYFCMMLCIWLTGYHGMNVATMQYQEKVLISLYFPETETHRMVEEKRFAPKDEVETTESRIQFVLEELQKGPISPMLEAPFPKVGTMELYCFSAHMAVVDFSREFIEAYSGENIREFLTYCSIINSLSNIPGVNDVKFTVEGEETEFMKGNFDLTETIDETIK